MRTEASPETPAAEVLPEGTATDEATTVPPETAEPEIAAPEIAALPPAPPPEPVVDDDPARLLGLGRSGVQGLLGAPALIRREATAEIWQYLGPACVFDVFLYETGGDPRVDYVEARDGEGRPSEARACFNGLLRARLAG